MNNEDISNKNEVNLNNGQNLNDKQEFEINEKDNLINVDNPEKTEPKKLRNIRPKATINEDANILKYFQTLLGDSGIESLFKTGENSLPKDVFLCIQIKCSTEFHEKYKKISKSLVTEGMNIGESTEIETIDKLLQTDGDENSKESLLIKDSKKIEKAENIPTSYYQEKLDETKKNLEILGNALEDLEFEDESSMISLLDQYIQLKSNKLKENNPELYEKGLKYSNNGIYCEIDFEDLIILFCGVIHLSTPVEIRFELGRDKNCLFMILYGNEDDYAKMAEDLNYECQLKPYSMIYDHYEKEKRRKTILLDIYQDKIALEKNDDALKEEKLSIIEAKKLEYYAVQEEINSEDPLIVDIISKGNVHQIEEFNERDPSFWPPYEMFSMKRHNKFRRYTPSDDIHICPLKEDQEKEDFSFNKFMLKKKEIDPDMFSKLQCPPNDIKIEDHINSGTFSNNLKSTCQFGCSYFRNIDKIRLLYDSFDRLIKISELKKIQFIQTIVIKRNYESYGPKIGIKSLICQSANIFNDVQSTCLLNKIRNYYGEIISFYFAWMDHYIKWLFFPAALGVLVGIISATGALKSYSIGGTIFGALDIFLLCYCSVIIGWATLFVQIWKQKETFYNYKWGTENFKQREPENELFTYTLKKKFVFGSNLLYYENWKRRLKQITSYLALIVMVSSTIAIMFVIMKYRKEYLDKYQGEGQFLKRISIIGVSSVVNSLQIKIFNICYGYLATFLNNWENYKSVVDKNSDLSIKLIIFDFFNCYSPLFYIGFYKPFNGTKPEDTLMELGTQLYTTFAMNLAFDLVEIAMPIMWYYINLYTYLKKIEKSGGSTDGIVIKPYSMTHQLLCVEYNNLIYEYNEMIILFGYMSLFGVTAPFAPLIILILVWIEKIFDVGKLFFLQRVQIIHQATGISIYNNLIITLMFIGMLTNSGIILFSQKKGIDKEIMFKLAAFLIVENLVLVIIFVLKWNILPFWFSEINSLKVLYKNKYFNKKLEPHHLIQGELQKLDDKLNAIKDQHPNISLE